MSSLVESSLLRAANSTFEELGFLLPDREPSESQRAAGADGQVSVVFRGPFEGVLVLRLYGGVLPVLAMNMLGESAPPDEALQRDALGEVANVICGNLLPAIAGSRAVFRLDAPSPGETAAPAGASLVCAVALGLEEGRAELAFHATGDLAQGGGAA